MSYVEWFIVGLFVISGLASLVIFRKLLCIFFWYYSPSSMLPPGCKRYKRNELLKNRVWERAFQINRQFGTIIEISILLVCYYTPFVILYFLMLLLLQFGVSMGIQALDAIVAPLLGMFCGLVFSWTILLLFAWYQREFSRSIKQGLLSPLITTFLLILPVIIEIIGPEQIRNYLSRIVHQDLTFSMLFKISLTPKFLVESIVEIVQILFFLNLVLVLVVGYRVGKIRNEILPR
ncbi:hypothetical protein [Thermococcus radiotolerans]|uniref:Uncharacterized protein n=1 Tax=Thermococcus radiotolerans TaxID=187880 RepID=A0A2Z2N2H0_9EURY|nr:hypothetical protein [Thermococcus radiotolerans]ASJ13782.1 hypothetical protein A3L10_01035 [Thermococcus radiotolerans]